MPYSIVTMLFLFRPKDDEKKAYLTCMITWNIVCLTASLLLLTSYSFADFVVSVACTVILALIYLSGSVLIGFELIQLTSKKLPKWKHRDKLLRIHFFSSFLFYLYSVFAIFSFSELGVSKTI